jgi:hypothetical protein
MNIINKISGILLITLVILIASFNSYADNKATLTNLVKNNSKLSQKTKDFITSKLIPICIDKTIIDEVAKQNSKGISDADIQKIDKEWMAAEEPTPFIQEKLNNACAKK